MHLLGDLLTYEISVAYLKCGCGLYTKGVIIIIIIIIIIIKKGWQCKTGKERFGSYQSEDLSSTIPTHRMKKSEMESSGRKKTGASS